MAPRRLHRWGGEAAYVAYKKETWVFLLLPARRTEASASGPLVVEDVYENVP